MTEFLKANGLGVGHESLGKHGMVSWDIARSILNGSIVPHGPVLHQVREPLATMNSLSAVNVRTWDQVRQAIDGIGKEMVHHVMHFYLKYNLLCERYSEFTFRVEDLPLEELSERLGVELSPVEIPKNLNTRKHIEWTWQDFLGADQEMATKVAQLATRYGYEVPL
jgi:hypothetical protein